MKTIYLCFIIIFFQLALANATTGLDGLVNNLKRGGRITTIKGIKYSFYKISRGPSTLSIRIKNLGKKNYELNILQLTGNSFRVKNIHKQQCIIIQKIVPLSLEGILIFNTSISVKNGRIFKDMQGCQRAQAPGGDIGTDGGA